MNMLNKLPEVEDAAVFPFDTANRTDGSEAENGLRRWRWPLVALGLVLLGLLGWKLFGTAPAPVAPPKTVPEVTVMVPGTTEVTRYLSVPGSIAAKRDEAIGVQGEGGRITAVLVEAGQQVKRGQVLARIDRSVQSQQAARAAADIRAAEADLALADADLSRALALVDRGFVSKADIDRRTATRDGARARVAVTKAQLGEINARIALLDVRAPSDGLILDRNVEAGQVVGAASPALFRLANGGVLEMQAQVAEQDMATLKPGMTATVTPAGADTGYTGTIWLIDPIIDPMSRLGVVRIALPYSPGLRVGAFAKAKIEAGTGVKPVLPQSAIQIDDKGNFVFVVADANKVARRGIEIGAVTDEGVSIASGLTGQEQVVVSAGAFLRAGESINPVKADPVKAAR